MKKYILDFFKNFKTKGAKHKAIVISIALLYVFIMCVCFIKVECDCTTPGDINRVGKVIEIKNEENTIDSSKIFTVSVYTKTKVSLAQYFIAKYLDKNVDISPADYSTSDFTINEYSKIDACAKKQSIQDSIIVAYEYAKKEGKDIELIYTYGGVTVTFIPANYYGTGPESLMIGDIVKKIGDIEITSMEVFREVVEDYDRQYDETIKNQSKIVIPEILVIREGKEVVLNACNPVVVANLGNLSTFLKENNISEHNYYFYDYYEIDYANSKPQIEIQAYNTVGPSGGLMQAIYVYNVITGGEIAKDKYLVGTGTISNDGSVGEIGGIKQKIITANIYLSDYFFVPVANYEEALEAYNDLKNPHFELVKVTTFEDAINALKTGEGK